MNDYVLYKKMEIVLKVNYSFPKNQMVLKESSNENVPFH